MSSDRADRTNRSRPFATALLVLLALMGGVTLSGCVGQGADSLTGPVGRDTPTPTPTWPYVPRTASLSSTDHGLEAAGQREVASLARWLVSWRESDQKLTSGRLRELAKSYQKVGLDRSTVPDLVTKAADAMDEAENLAEERDYEAATKKYGSAVTTLGKVAPAVRKDVSAAETRTGYRLAGRGGVAFPTRADSTSATIEFWVDGDTVETSAGRVRLIGVDTPEMKDRCSLATAAKEHAERLAPPGTAVKLLDPVSVRGTDRYGRLLRYVVVDSGSVDVGYSLIRSELAVARYDSRDGFQWHPRERAYREASSTELGRNPCLRVSEKLAFMTAVALAAGDEEHEHHRSVLLGTSLERTARVATKLLPARVKATRKRHQAADQAAEAAAAAERAEAERREAERREAERQSRYEDDDRSYEAPDTSDSKSSSGSDDDSSGSYPGYNGPRCYAPGGKSWKPC